MRFLNTCMVKIVEHTPKSARISISLNLNWVFFSLNLQKMMATNIYETTQLDQFFK